MASPINYAVEYSQALAQAYPNVLHFGALYATPNNGRYRWVNARTIEIPRIKTTGRTDADRDSIGTATRNYDNSWETKVLKRQRKWSTLVHPMDIDQTNQVASITNITQTFNAENKFPEMDAYTISGLYEAWTTKDAQDDEDKAYVADTTALTVENILTVFDDMMVKMDEANVPAAGRILYVTAKTKKMINNAEKIYRSINVASGANAVDRTISRLDEVEIVPVPSSLMKTKYTFTTGYTAAEDAKQILMFLVHPTAVIAPTSYEFAQLDPPSAMTEGKYYYFEESHEDVFILNKRKDALQFVVEQGE